MKQNSDPHNYKLSPTNHSSKGHARNVIRENRSSNSIKVSKKDIQLEESKKKEYNKTQKPEGSNSESSFSDNDNKKYENLSPIK
jgi:hypothetical protein